MKCPKCSRMVWPRGSTCVCETTRPASSGTVECVVGPRHCALCGEWPARETKNGLRCHLCECRDICAEYPVPMPGDSDKTALRELVDGAWPIIELWCAKSPEQIRWKRAWLAKANALIGANGTGERP